MIKITEGKIGYSLPILEIPHLEIQAGTLTALIGKNGSGKSTLLKSLCGLTPLLGGNFLINTHSIVDLDEKSLSHLVSFVGSVQVPIPYLTVKEFVLLGRSPYTGVLGRYAPKDHQLAEESLELFDLSPKSACTLDELSDGERQLAAFARAFAQSTPVILMDEPTAFLDYGNKRSLLSILKSVTLSSQKCVLISTHDLDLCAEESIGILGIDFTKSTLTHYPDGTSKNEMLKEFF